MSADAAAMAPTLSHPPGTARFELFAGTTVDRVEADDSRSFDITLPKVHGLDFVVRVRADRHFDALDPERVQFPASWENLKFCICRKTNL